MTVLSCKTSIFAFSKDNEPVKRVASGTTIQIETYDCFQNQIQSVDTEFNVFPPMKDIEIQYETGHIQLAMTYDDEEAKSYQMDYE
jgi:acetamidase/formamidase